MESLWSLYILSFVCEMPVSPATQALSRAVRTHRQAFRVPSARVLPDGSRIARGLPLPHHLPGLSKSPVAVQIRTHHTVNGHYLSSASPRTPNRGRNQTTSTSSSKRPSKTPRPAKMAHHHHPPFKQVEASRPPFTTSTTFTYTQTPNPTWQFGDGATTPPPSNKKHIPIDPHHSSRTPSLNYKLLISAVIPRPIAFLSTRSADGSSTNLAPFSYFQLIAHDPPLFVVSFSCPLPPHPAAKDSLRNLHETGECVINIISEGFVEAANSTSVNAPYGVSEWAVSGLTPVYDCQTVGCARVGEAVFAIEGRVESLRELPSRARPGEVGSTLAVIEGTRFWAREDALDEEAGGVIDARVGFLLLYLFFCLA